MQTKKLNGGFMYFFNKSKKKILKKHIVI